MKKIIRISEQKLRKVINKIISEQYDTESPIPEIIDKLSTLGISDEYLTIAEPILLSAEAAHSFKTKKEIILNFKHYVNELMDDSNLGVPKNKEEKESLRRSLLRLELLLDSLCHKADFGGFSLN